MATGMNLIGLEVSEEGQKRHLVASDPDSNQNAFISAAFLKRYSKTIIIIIIIRNDSVLVDQLSVVDLFFSFLF